MSRAELIQLMRQFDLIDFRDEDDDQHVAQLVDAVEALVAKAAKVELESIEQYRLQMAAISTAALGYWKEGDDIRPEYDTLALRDVAKLYAKYDKLYKARPPVDQKPYVWYDPETGATWTNEVLADGYSTEGLIPLYAAPQPPVVEQEPVAEVIVSHTRAGLNGQYTAEVASRERLSVGAELFIHPQNLRCKSTQARLATLWGYVKERPQQEQEWKRRLGNLLAVIHGDGGHYIDAHGWDKAQADAEEKVARVMTGLPQSASAVWPRNAREVRAFLSGHVAAERYARDDHQPDDSDTYTLSAHDLLGAIDWWTDFDQRPRQPLTDEQINTLFQWGCGQSFRDFARAIERAHHIGDEK